MWWFLACAEPVPAPVIDLSPERPDTTDTLTVHRLDTTEEPSWYRDGDYVLDGTSIGPELTRRGERWTVRVGSATETTLIGNAPPSATFSIDPPAPTVETGLRLAVDGRDPDGDPLTVAVEWLVDGEVRSVEPVVPGDALRSGERWLAAVRVSDGEATIVGEVAVSIANTPPVLEGVLLVPDAPTATDLIEADVQASDADGDPLVASYAWSIDGVESPIEGSIFAGAGKGEVVSVSVTVTDGSVTTAPQTASVTIRNTPPVLSGVVIEPEVLTRDTVAAAVPLGWSDVDGDLPAFRYQWTVDGVVAGESETLSGFSRDQVVSVAVTPVDETDAGVPVTAERRVANLAPGAPGLFLPDRHLDGLESLVCEVREPAEDPDGDEVSYLFDWAMDGAAVSSVGTTHHPGDTILTSQLATGRWRCTARAADDGAVGPAASVETDVLVDGNVLVIVLDDISPFWVGAYDELEYEPHTPVIDALAAEGMLFRNAYANTSCSPTRAALLTGRYARRYGIGKWIPSDSEDHGLPYEEETLAELVLRSPYGYTSAALGKWHVTGLTGAYDMTHPLLQGFETHAGSASNILSFYDWTRYEDGVSTYVTNRYATTDTTDDAIAQIAQRAEPWLIWVGYNAPHSPWHVPPAALQPQSGVVAPASKTDRYRAMIEAVDTEMGRLLAALAPEVRSRTTIVVVGDNGSVNTFVPDENGKGTLYETGVKVPLVIASPYVAEPGSESTSLVHAVDLYPTVAGIAGVDVSLEVLDGVSLLPLLADPQASVRDRVYVEKFAPIGDPPHDETFDQRALLDTRYKLYRTFDGDQFFDLAAEEVTDGTDLLSAGSLSVEEESAYERLSDELDAIEAMLGIP